MSEVRIADKLVSLEDVLNTPADNVYYSVGTCWWTTDPEHLTDIRKLRGDSVGSIPTDPAGAPLLMTDDVIGFLKDAQSHPEHYGRHGINAFMLAYHGNIVSPEGLPRCSAQWDSYNDLLDEQETQP